jgi:hypothetical protein
MGLTASADFALCALGRAALPSEEGMLAAVQLQYMRMEENGMTRCHKHVLVPEWVSTGSIAF